MNASPAAPPDVLIVGAGIAGLTLARALRDAGRRPLVLERAPGVGGRCATRRIGDAPVDHGAPFAHGRTREFLDVIASTAEGRIAGWPRACVGEGFPCHPEALLDGHSTSAWRDGQTRLPKALAEDTDVRLGARVMRLDSGGAADRAGVTLESGERIEAASVVLAMPGPQAVALVETLGDAEPAVARARTVLGLPRFVACLAAVACYAPGTPVPDWEACYPGHTSALHAAFHDSSKRAAGTPVTLVFHARPGYSREHLGDEDRERWAAEMLAEAASAHGAWIAAPSELTTHVWKYARVAPGTGVAGPAVLPLANGATLGLCGDGFHPAGGLEGAFLSARMLAGRLTGAGAGAPSA